MSCEHDEFKRPLSIKLSGTLAPIVALVAIILALPPDTNLILTTICGVSVYFLADMLHFKFVEKPFINQWLTEHNEKYHPIEGIIDDMSKEVDK